MAIVVITWLVSIAYIVLYLFLFDKLMSLPFNWCAKQRLAWRWAGDDGPTVVFPIGGSWRSA
jgi:hypothetical protein